MQLYAVDNTKVFPIPAFHALIPAAGSGTRIAGELPKQYLPLWQRPMLWHAVQAVAQPPVENVFVVLAPDDRHFGNYDWTAFHGRLQPLYCGGPGRRDSVYNGLVATMDVLDPEDWILVHDAARPCLSQADLARLIAQAGDDPVGGILALPVIDSVKRMAKDESGAQRIAGSEDRSLLWHAQTPQMFRAGLLIRALKEAKREVTDEAGAVEQMGLRPRLVAGSRENLKVTFPEDLGIAEAILARKPK